MKDAPEDCPEGCPRQFPEGNSGPIRPRVPATNIIRLLLQMQARVIGVVDEA
jgi:hypothetical protein